MGYLGIAAGVLGLLFIGNSPLPEKNKPSDKNFSYILETS
jgi:hypothetical protein